MPRTVPSAVLTAAEAAVTTPGYLIEIQTPTPLRYTTRATLTYDSKTWSGGARVESLPTTPGGEVTLVLPNADGALGALILGDVFGDTPALIYVISEAAPTAAVLIFSGVVDEASDIGLMTCTLTLSDTAAAASSVPDVVIGPPLCNHLIPSGAVIVWGGVSYTVEAQ